MADDKPETTALVTKGPELPEPVARRGISEAQWRTLKSSLFPGAKSESVLLVWDYCLARKLDPMKKPCHIVPMEVKSANTYEWRDVVMPGIYEYRTTAHRTGEYLGHSEPQYGAPMEFPGVTAPEWCAMAVYRWNKHAQQRTEFPVRVFFGEVLATKKDNSGKYVANARWKRAPIQMLTKCTEAAALREAFPEEFGGEMTAEEMDGQRAIDITPPKVAEATINLLDKLPEGLRDNLERALSALKLTIGQRQARINQFMGSDDVVPEEGAATLLAWAEGELKQPAEKPKPDNGRKKKPAAEPEAPPLPISSEDIPF